MTRALRFVVGLALLGAWSLWLVSLVDGGAPATKVVAGVLFCVPLCSLWEWLVHGVLYHRGVPGLRFIRVIHLAHHAALFPPRRYTHEGRHAFMFTGRPLRPWRMSETLVQSAFTAGSQVALHFVAGLPSIALPAWWLTHDVVFTASVFVSLAVVSWGLAYVHGCIHTPRDRFIESTGFFCWLDRHHYIHHIDMDANVNFGLPLCDFLFGTRKAALTPDEAAENPTFEAAKPMAHDVLRA
jgi:hypothetical protein